MFLRDEVPFASVLFIEAVATLCLVRYGVGASCMRRDSCFNLLSRTPRDAASCVIRDYRDVWKHRFLRDVIFRQARCVSVFGTVVLTTVWSGMFYGRYHPVLYRMIYPVFSGMVSRRERDGCGCASGSIVPFVTGVSGQALSRVLRDVAE